jgi:hypothetical protein
MVQWSAIDPLCRWWLKGAFHALPADHSRRRAALPHDLPYAYASSSGPHCAPAIPRYGEGHASVHFVAARCGGLAISYATVIAALIVVVLWGVFMWNEVRGANPTAKTYLAATFLCYLLALFVIAQANNAAA